MTHREGTIEELCNVEYGTRVVRKRDSGTIYPVYGGGGETFFLDTFNRENRVVIARFAMSEKCTRRVLGKFALNDSGLTVSPRDQAVLRQDFLDYYILSLNDQIYQSARGTAQKNLDVPAFRKMKITYPASLDEQREIVEKLDKASVEMDLIEGNLGLSDEKANQLLQSLLSVEFTFSGDSGQPTSPLVNQGLVMSFTSKPLGELCTLTMGRTPPRGNARYWDSSRKTKNIWISIADMTKSLDDTLIDSKEYLSDEGSNSFPKVKMGTLLLSFKLSIGKLAIAGADLQTNEAIMAMNELNEDLILRDYLYYFLRGFDWSEALEGRFKVKGNTLNKKILEELPIKFPSIEKQREIVVKLDIASAEIESLKAQIKVKKDSAAALRQSLLNSAFAQQESVA